MKNSQTPKEFKTKSILKIQQNKLPLEQIQLKQNLLSPQNSLKTTPSTSFYERKASKNYNVNIPKINSPFNNNYELAQQNKKYYKKLFEIRNHKTPKQYSTQNILNKHRNDGYIKLGIMNLAQENLFMLKRLYELKSEYSAKKMEKEYQKVQRIKRIMCKFPDINFNKSKGLVNESFFLKSGKSDKSDKSDKSEFLPTINYINEGSMIKVKKHLLIDMKKKGKNFILPRNLKKEFLKRNFKKIQSKINLDKKENRNMEFEFDLDKGKKDINHPHKIENK